MVDTTCLKLWALDYQDYFQIWVVWGEGGGGGGGEGEGGGF